MPVDRRRCHVHIRSSTPLNKSLATVRRMDPNIQVFTHCTIIEIGEKIRLEKEEAAEDSKQKAIRCTEEYARREETQKRECELSQAKEEWKKEKKKIFHEAHQSQLRTIANHTAILEDKLKEEFKEKTDKIESENREHLKRALHSTQEEAEKMKNKAVLEARYEEQCIAQETIQKLEIKVAQEKRDDQIKAEIDKAKAIDDLTKHMDNLHKEAMDEQKRLMEEHFAATMEEMNRKHESRLADLEEKLTGEIERIRCALHEMTLSRNNLEQKYKDLKMEFSDFIDQFPGFGGEFIL